MGNEVANANEVSRVGIDESFQPSTRLLVLELDNVGEGDVTTGLHVVFQGSIQVVVLGVE